MLRWITRLCSDLGTLEKILRAVGEYIRAYEETTSDTEDPTMNLSLLLFGLLLAVPPAEQGHISGGAQCRAEAERWGSDEAMAEYANSQLKFHTDRTPNRSNISRLGYAEIRARVTEMTVCAVVDEARTQRYLAISWFYASVTEDRESDFIRRHNLLAQFMLEDDQGKR